MLVHNLPILFAELQKQCVQLCFDAFNWFVLLHCLSSLFAFDFLICILFIILFSTGNKII